MRWGKKLIGLEKLAQDISTEACNWIDSMSNKKEFITSWGDIMNAYRTGRSQDGPLTESELENQAENYTISKSHRVLIQPIIKESYKAGYNKLGQKGI